MENYLKLKKNRILKFYKQNVLKLIPFSFFHTSSFTESISVGRPQFNNTSLTYFIILPTNAISKGGNGHDHLTLNIILLFISLFAKFL